MEMCQLAAHEIEFSLTLQFFAADTLLHNLQKYNDFIFASLLSLIMYCAFLLCLLEGLPLFHE